MNQPESDPGVFRSSLSGQIAGIAGDEYGISIKRPSLIERTDQLNGSLDHLEQMLADLRHRLEPVVRPSEPSGAPVLAEVHDSGSWLSDYLVDVTGRVQTICGSVFAFTERVDL